MTPPITITLLQQIIMSQKPSLSRDERNERNSEIRRELPPGGDRPSLSGLIFSQLAPVTLLLCFSLVCLDDFYDVERLCVYCRITTAAETASIRLLLVFYALQGSPSSCMFRVEITLAVLMTVFAVCY